MACVRAAGVQALRFVWLHRFHALLCLPALVGVTVLHEAAHALAVVLLGGEVTYVSFWPTRERWGHVSWHEPPAGMHLRWLVTLAPYLMWLTLAGAAAVFAALSRPKPLWLASTVFVWCFALPVLDVALAICTYGLYRSGDLLDLFGPSTAARITITVIGAVLFGTSGYVVQRKLYGDCALGPMAYAMLALASAAALMAL